MKRLSILMVSLAVLLYLGGGLAFAQGKPPEKPSGGAPSGVPQGKPPEKPAPPAKPSNPQEGKAPTTAGEKKSVEQLLTQNTKLSSRISTLTGMDAQAACAGFKNLGQCVAAAHVSKNLEIPFADLKTKLTTAEEDMTLGKAIEGLKPGVDAAAEAKKAEKQAKEDIKKSES